jgi:hypothetical protein
LFFCTGTVISGSATGIIFSITFAFVVDAGGIELVRFKQLFNTSGVSFGCGCASIFNGTTQASAEVVEVVVIPVEELHSEFFFFFNSCEIVAVVSFVLTCEEGSVDVEDDGGTTTFVGSEVGDAVAVVVLSLGTLLHTEEEFGAMLYLLRQVILGSEEGGGRKWLLL